MSSHSSRTDRIAYWVGLAAALLAVGGAFLIAASQTNCDGWASFFVISGAVSIFASAYLFGALFVGRGLPDMGEERRRKKLEREHDALLARFARRDAFQELRDELGSNARDLSIQLANERVFWISHGATAWEKNRHLLNAHPETGELVRDAYRRTQALNDHMQERYGAAGQAEINDPAWLKLSEEEIRERTAALEAVEKAIGAVRVANDAS